MTKKSVKKVEIPKIVIVIIPNKKGLPKKIYETPLVGKKFVSPSIVAYDWQPLTIHLVLFDLQVVIL